ncbi:unnamed protein product [Urochloa humidicola]
MDRRSAQTKIGFAVLAFNSALAIGRSWGDAGSVAFVLAADAALALIFLCLREFERAGGGDGVAARNNNMAGPYSALARVGLAVVACNAALDAYGGRGDALSAALVLACFSFLVILTGLFVRAFARAH